MKRIVPFLTLLFVFPLLIVAQNFTLTINSKNLTADSLRVRAFDGKKAYTTLAVAPYSATTVLKMKDKIPAGLYKIQKDTTDLFDLLISEEKKQNISATIGADGNPVFANSQENSNFQTYLRQTEWFAAKADSINHVFEEAQKTMPQYMLQTLAQNLMQEAEGYTAQETAYKQKVMDENKGTLLASVVQFSKQLPPPPREYYGNQGALNYYYTIHSFDNFPFDDPRMASTPLAAPRIRKYAAEIYYLQPSAAAELADELLNKARVNPTIYHCFFDNLEAVLGTLKSPYFTEEIYIAMLRNALDYDKIDKKRVNYYQQLLDLHTKNLPGTKIPDFQVLWSDSSKSSIYDIQSEYMLLYFQNPDCPTCTEVRGKLAVNEDVNRAIESGKLKVVTIYFEDDRALWERYLRNHANPKYLHGWDYQNEINSKNLFDLRIIPYMFLLDKDKVVLKKDMLYNEVSDILKYYKIY